MLSSKASDEIARTLRNNPEMDWTMIYDGSDRPAMLVWWLKSGGNAPLNQTYARFTANGRILVADGKALGHLRYRNAGTLSQICADISSRARTDRERNTPHIATSGPCGRSGLCATDNIRKFECVSMAPCNPALAPTSEHSAIFGTIEIDGERREAKVESGFTYYRSLGTRSWRRCWAYRLLETFVTDPTPMG